MFIHDLKPLDILNYRDVNRGQTLEAEAEARTLSRVEAEAKFNRPIRGQS